MTATLLVLILASLSFILLVLRHIIAGMLLRIWLLLITQRYLWFKVGGEFVDWEYGCF